LWSTHYNENAPLPFSFSSMIIAALIAIGLNIAFAMLRKKTTDIEKMSKIMKESVEFRKQMMAAVKKQDKALIAELKKKQAYVNKMNLEVQQQQMKPMFIYMIPSFMLWILVFPYIFGGVVALSPIHPVIPWITCNENNVKNDIQKNPDGTHKGVCRQVGQIYLWGWFLIVNFAFNGIISKITKTALPSIT
ncbi:MAG: EMC3/TMCO1 family protein, partial [Nitrososphaeraceae archaeon]|nr:EMC3/TMCO1 family protein [Nitrososphaeraceae archaeon]